MPPFVKGQSGNPAGKAVGTRSKATLMAEAMFDGAAEKIIKKCLEMALEIPSRYGYVPTGFCPLAKTAQSTSHCQRSRLLPTP